MLRWRITLGACFIAALIGLCWIDHAVVRRGLVMLAFACLTGVLATGELLQLFRKGNHRVRAVATHVAVLVAIGSAGLPVLMPGVSENTPVGPAGWLAIGVIAGFFLSILAEMPCYCRAEKQESARFGATTVQLSLSAFSLLYVGGLLGFLVLLRTLTPSPNGHDWGLLALVSVLVVVKLGDSAAYTVGRLWGRHKMAPRLSPGKTWEGAAGGLAASCLGAWITLALVPTWLGWTDGAATTLAWIAYGAVVGVAGMVGDLTESLLKRDVGVKDSSTWLPGFGGVLDLLDSLLVAAPIAYLFWITGAVGP